MKQTDVPIYFKWSYIVATSSTSIGLTTEGELIAWGSKDRGGTYPISSYSQGPFTDLTAWGASGQGMSGIATACGLQNGKPTCMGFDGYGESTGSISFALSTNFTSISTKFRRSVGITTAGNLAYWGNPKYINPIPKGKWLNSCQVGFPNQAINVELVHERSRRRSKAVLLFGYELNWGQGTNGTDPSMKYYEVQMNSCLSCKPTVWVTMKDPNIQTSYT